MNEINQTLGMGDAELISAVGAFFLPLLIAFIMRSTWSDRVRYLVSLLVYVLYAFLTIWFLNYVVFDDNTTAKEVVRAFLLSAVIGYGAFKLVWQPTGQTFKIENREAIKSGHGTVRGRDYNNRT